VPRPDHTHDAFTVHGRPSPGRVVYTAEHASNRVPSPWRPRPADRRLLAMHWGYDLGAAALARELARLGGGAAVLSRFSRLLLDPNRHPDDPTAILAETPDGAPTFNRALHPGEHARRVARLHVPFHDAIERTLRAGPARFLVSVHSFTPVYRGQPRAVEAGVLYDRDDALAEALVDALRGEGLDTRPNEPYSGKDGLIYSAARHGAACGIRYVELELRQDLLASDRRARGIARKVRRALLAVGIEGEGPLPA